MDLTGAISGYRDFDDVSPSPWVLVPPNSARPDQGLAAGRLAQSDSLLFVTLGRDRLLGRGHLLLGDDPLRPDLAWNHLARRNDRGGQIFNHSRAVLPDHARDHGLGVRLVPERGVLETYIIAVTVLDVALFATLIRHLTGQKGFALFGPFAR